MKNLIYSILCTLLAIVSLSSCSQDASESESFSPAEINLISGCDSIMRVLTIADSLDYEVLRAKSCDLPASALLSDEYAKLEKLLIATVTHPSQDGVGIAGPQVGLNRRVVAVQRFDKEGEPFEVYPNISIVWASASLSPGPEGCLSVPDRRGEVMRAEEIVIEYADMKALRQVYDINPCSKAEKNLGFEIPIIRDTVSGFTAVIFQHEADHLDGVLYIDRLKGFW